MPVGIGDGPMTMVGAGGGGAGAGAGGAGVVDVATDGVTLAGGGGTALLSATGGAVGADAVGAGAGPAAHAVDIAAMVTTIAPRDMRPSSISDGTLRAMLHAQNGHVASSARTWRRHAGQGRNIEARYTHPCPDGNHPNPARRRDESPKSSRTRHKDE